MSLTTRTEGFIKQSLGDNDAASELISAVTAGDNATVAAAAAAAGVLAQSAQTLAVQASTDASSASIAATAAAQMASEAGQGLFAHKELGGVAEGLAHGAWAIELYDNDERFTATDVEAGMSEVKALVDAAAPKISGMMNTLFVVELTAEAEADDARVVNGQVVNALDLPVAEGSVTVVIRTIPITSGKGLMTIVTGSMIKSTPNEMWLDTLNDGSFSVSVANDQVENTLVIVQSSYGLVSTRVLSFV